MFELQIPAMAIPFTDENYSTLEELASAYGQTAAEYAQKMVFNIIADRLNAEMMIFRMSNPKPDPQRN